MAFNRFGVIGNLYPVIAEDRTVGIHIPGRGLFASMEESGPRAVLDALQRLHHGLTNPQRPSKIRMNDPNTPG